MAERFIGIDIGAETVKVVVLTREGGTLRWTDRRVAEHHKEPARALLELLGEVDWDAAAGAAVSGRASRVARLPRVPGKQAQAAGFRFLFGGRPATVVSIGSHGFSVLELRESGVEVFRENSRCSQGTGNFLRQLVERFDMGIEEADALSAGVPDPAPLSGRCPVILKTDMTHLANGGESRARILAGLYDAVCENVQVLVKPSVSPETLVLVGGVSRAHRVKESFRKLAERSGMTLLSLEGDDGLYLDALGSAVVSSEQPVAPPPLDRVLSTGAPSHLDRVPPLASFLPQVERLRAEKVDPAAGPARDVVLGFDIGSTGSKVVAVDVHTKEPIWEAYGSTSGDPVGAAQALMRRFVEGPAARHRVRSVAATGSGREIVGSLASTCYGAERVYVLNEIAAHAAGALHHDPRVDTIFEIGGQDAKYVRLSAGRVVDAAMNEACSAGTGSFIEEQGKKFSGIRDVVHLGEEALLADEGGVSLGQHCSVFMAEIIDEAVAGGVGNRSVIAGIYDSIVQNYLNRVKGSRSVGDVVFCQGMPFASDALAAAVARRTGSKVIVPPNPGTVGALGIALLAIEALETDVAPVLLDPQRFLEAAVSRRDTFVCKSETGCGEPGNRCRIDRIATVVAGEKQRFTWGGGCSLWDKGTGRKKLPDLTPDPFRQREALIEEIVQRVTANHRPGQKRIAVTDEFQLKPLFPFFATFLDALGFDVVYHRAAGAKTLKRGIERANVPFCAPMQLYHGMVTTMVDADAGGPEPDYLFAPMLREMPRAGDEDHAVACPIVQGAPDILRRDLGEDGGRILSPVVDFGEDNLDSAAFLTSCHRLAVSLGVPGLAWWRAYHAARRAQDAFQERCLELGREALDFARAHDLVSVIVLGRPYTIYNEVLNSHVPPLVREQGAIAIPIDCYPVEDDVPIFEGLFWGWGQRNLRAAHQVRRTDGQYAIWCSNYSCGPDSFNLHFLAYGMEGKPFAIIETDGHSGDAGTKTRVEAFLHCVREHLARDTSAPEPPVKDLRRIVRNGYGLPEIRRNAERLLVPRMGGGAEAMVACLRGVGVDAEILPIPDREGLEIGRRHTSGKECIPMTITLGSLLQRLHAEEDPDRRFAFFMPTADGPCRFGAYNVLHRAVLERLGMADRVRIWSPHDDGYFKGLPAGLSALVMTGFAAHDTMTEALYHVRPTERRAGEADAIFARHEARLFARLEEAARGDLSAAGALLSVASGRLFGVADVVRGAAKELAAVATPKELPTVLMVGEIYVRCDPFANDFVIDKLEERGLRVRFAPFNEWLEYCDYINRSTGAAKGFGAQLTTLVQKRIQTRVYAIVAEVLGWPPRTTVEASLDAARPYLREELAGEAVLTIGGPLHEHHEGLIDGVVSVGPLECMPTKIAEALFFHAAEHEGLASLTLPFNGDPIDPETLDGFAFEMHTRFAKRAGGAASRGAPARAGVTSGAEAAASPADKPPGRRVRLHVTP